MGTRMAQHSVISVISPKTKPGACSQATWKYEFDTLNRGNEMLQDTRNMYRKELPVDDQVTKEPSSAGDIGDHLSEYHWSMILTPAMKKTVPPTKKTRLRLFLLTSYQRQCARVKDDRSCTLSYLALPSY